MAQTAVTSLTLKDGHVLGYDTAEVAAGSSAPAYTDEDAQDAVGNILADSASIDFTYNDAAPSITGDLKSTAVTPGTYTNATLTVGQDGRLTAALSGGSASGGGADPRTAIYPIFAPAGDDDEFDDGSFAGWTAANSGSHAPTLTETNNALSVLHPGGDAAAELHAWVKARTVNAGDYIETSFRTYGRAQNFTIGGLLFSNGAVYNAANAQVILYHSPNEAGLRWGDHTKFNTAGSQAGAGEQLYAPHGDLFMRLKYEGSNNWRGYASPDGISWLDFTGSFSRTLTPTHAGFFVTTWGGANPHVWSFRYVRFGS